MACTATIPGIAGQPAPDLPGEQRRSRNPGRRSSGAARRSAPRTGLGSWSRSSSSVPARPNRSVIEHLDAALGQHRVDLRPCSCCGCPTSLARCRTSSRSSRVAGGAIHASGSRPIRSRSARSRGVPLVVLHPPVLERLDPQRMRQMHLGAQLLQRVDRPVPAVGGLEHHLRGLAGPGHHRGQPLDVVADPDALQRVTVGGHPDDHRPSPVQIDSHELLTGIGFAHRGLLRRTDVSTASLTHWRSPTRSGGPAPSSHQRHRDPELQLSY